MRHERKRPENRFLLLVSLPLIFLAVTCLADEGKKTICPDPRPEVCTMEFDPVCAARDRVECANPPCDEAQLVTYSNGCLACTDEKVYLYWPGECPRPAVRITDRLR